MIKQYQLIALIKVIFKFVANAYASCLSPAVHQIISLTQTAFIKGRLILDGALSLHELKVKKLPSIMLKLDFKKSYNRVSWQSLGRTFTGKCLKLGMFTRLCR
jgi:hypothetical protein